MTMAGRHDAEFIILLAQLVKIYSPILSVHIYIYVYICVYVWSYSPIVENETEKTIETQIELGCMYVWGLEALGFQK